MEEIEGDFSLEGSGYKESVLEILSLRNLWTTKMGVYHMQFDVWVWTFSKEAKNQESSAGTWQLKLLESLGLFLWTVAAGRASQREN